MGRLKSWPVESDGLSLHRPASSGVTGGDNSPLGGPSCLPAPGSARPPPLEAGCWSRAVSIPAPARPSAHCGPLPVQPWLRMEALCLLSCFCGAPGSALSWCCRYRAPRRTRRLGPCHHLAVCFFILDAGSRYGFKYAVCGWVPRLTCTGLFTRFLICKVREVGCVIPKPPSDRKVNVIHSYHGSSTPVLCAWWQCLIFRVRTAERNKSGMLKTLLLGGLCLNLLPAISLVAWGGHFASSPQILPWELGV